jgi:hypothetical protein
MDIDFPAAASFDMQEMEGIVLDMFADLRNLNLGNKIQEYNQRPIMADKGCQFLEFLQRHLFGFHLTFPFLLF